MLYSRQRLLLNLLDAVGGEATNTDFQKWLFLYTQEMEAEPSYHFVPYQFGCFSFTAYADKRKLVEFELLDGNAEGWQLTPEGRREAHSRRTDLAAFSARYGCLHGRKLVAEVYRRHPYYAINSRIAEEVLTDSASRDAVAAARPASKPAGLVTVGYEGKCLEQYLNELIRNGVTLLCDVRRNPLSRKYGFSKGTLQPACENLGIRYVHLPQLGIASEQRKELNTQSDYDSLFAGYVAHDLPGQTAALDTIAAWVSSGERVALTCFEKEPHQCHRHCVAQAVEARHREIPPVFHI